MNTPTISSALPAAPSNPGGTRTGDSREPDANTPNFSSVLTRQQTNEPAPVKVISAPTDTGSKQGDQHDVAADDAKPTDEAAAEQIAEQGLGLPQIALNIAAEAALAIAARLPGAVHATPGNAAAIDTTLSAAAQQNITPANADGLAAELARGNPLVTPFHAAQAGVNSAAALAAAAKQDATAKAQMLAIRPDTSVGTPAKAIELPAGFVPMQARAQPFHAALDARKALPHQTELNLRKAPAVAANIRKNAVSAQGLAVDVTLAKTATLDATALAADIASVSARTSFAAASTQIDLSASQAGSITAASGATPFPTSLGSLPNTGAQVALPGIATPLQSPQWGAEFGRQFVSLTQGGHNMPHTAELRLDPPELGPLRISINISDNVAHAIFTSPHAAVRQTVENSLPQLQQLLAQAGISLGQTSVNDQGQADQSFNESFGAGRKSANTGSGGTIVDVSGLDARSPARSRAPDALVDTFV
ncbi:hypothetical protein CR155_19515 [Pollutimonas nitritireducens]|uniref:Flagellar hook-length control protein-like C-terminal domain-containing protein n=1 Tax=Pollutimonas nitritireducens TaxID=2045209 RepID=A0A2N4UB41_9BURK|nr:flagellar hook-length control protein FliK [Pollutimonas nitritireducens]PLC52236.1 hypothetical protein CR155_19515 [Pollutimonas nitritireducens]